MTQDFEIDIIGATFCWNTILRIKLKCGSYRLQLSFQPKQLPPLVWSPLLSCIDDLVKQIWSGGGFLCVLWCNIHPLAQGSTHPSICPCQQFVLQKSSQLFQIVLPIFFSIIFSKVFGLGRQVRALYFLLDLRRRSRGVTLVWISGFPKAVASLSALDSVLSLPFFRVSFAQILASENFTLACPSPGNCPAVHSWEQPFNMIFFWLYYEVGVPGENPHRQGEHAKATQQDPKWPANSNLLQQLWKTWYHSVAACIKRAVWRKLRLRQISFILQCLKEMTCTN